jgi:hypothetical protein
MPNAEKIAAAEHPDRTPDRNVEKAVEDTFPASDAPSGTAIQGARAVPPEHMMDQGKPEAMDSVTLTRRFPDAESAKLALEALVRSVPLDRSCTELAHDPAFELRLRVPRDDAGRVDGMLQAV